MAYKLDDVETFYDFKGLWDTPSRCGLKIIKKQDKTYIIATELFTGNPGSSVTDCNAKLAIQVCESEQLDPTSIYFIEHVPDRGSRLVFYEETFYHVDLDWDGQKFSNPRWTKLSRPEIEFILS